MRSRYVIHTVTWSFCLLLSLRICSADDKRKGVIAEVGLGPGYTDVSFPGSPYNSFNTYGLGATAGVGFAPTNRSSIIFGFRSNIFVDEVASVYQDWNEKMKGDGAAALGAKFLCPFVYTLAPLFRSHSIFGLVEYTQFMNDTSPSLFITGNLGGGFVYNKVNGQNYAGLGLSVGTGYEFAGKVAVNCDFIYNSSEEDVRAISVLVTLKKFFY